ncbi:peroxiredoxin [Flavobacterium sp. LB2P84]|jgi:peroxiredoxin Q/BCP|uniref:peroxiredoxin n=1 Tax=Flavobacterium yafengii TaxID=3041253 RepID=UPI0024A819C4|nr:peroxiredoxin [Flavobacterium yafengii]MDI5898214.1 peroxiredoxin [Flavobacterium yafengii]MDI6034119.1 peroxiredoxin [Flavobacterium yafengii]MDI6046557.1 peroxiredoxin [Flavobacterium yafengii]
MGLKVGDTIPNFKAKDANGNDFDSQNIVGKKPLVIYFYPKDNTPGCTTEACSFRDQYEDFTALGAEVIGISSDSVSSHQQFSTQFKLPFILLSDNDKKIKNLFGVPSGLFGLLPGRVTYVTDKNGVIQMIFDSILAAKHIPKALQAIQKLVS